jgi:hypothetical protein
METIKADSIDPIAPRSLPECYAELVTYPKCTANSKDAISLLRTDLTWKVCMHGSRKGDIISYKADVEAVKGVRKRFLERYYRDIDRVCYDDQVFHSWLHDVTTVFKADMLEVKNDCFLVLGGVGDARTVL